MKPHPRPWLRLRHSFTLFTADPPPERKREIYNLADGTGSMGNSMTGKMVAMMVGVKARGAAAALL